MLIKGIGVGRGAVVGVVLRMPEPSPEPVDEASQASPVEESRRAIAALSAVATELLGRREQEDGEADDVLEAQAMMAQDPALLQGIEAKVAGGKTAERAVFEAFRGFQESLESMGGYMAARAADLADVSQRTIAELRGVPVPAVPQSESPFVLVADDLAPADTAILDLDKVLAVVTRGGGPTSHTAILARARRLVAVVGAAGAEKLEDGQTVIVDASTGVVTVDPSEEEVNAVTAQSGPAIEAESLTPGALADGTRIPLLANLGAPVECAMAVALGAEGVGLFRTEFLFLDAKEAPSVETQRDHYLELLKAFPGKKVIVRVLDAGADKPLAFLQHNREENPALGSCGIRALRSHEWILRDQLSALAQAQELLKGEKPEKAPKAQLCVMAPMVADAEETKWFVDLAHELGLGTAGATIEVPSAALLADQVLSVADFASIGTNDLTQYTLAADRLLGSVSDYQDPWHPAVLRLVKMVGEAGAKAHKPVGICGEAAADPELAVVLVGLGVTELSMSASALADVRAELSRYTLEQAQALARHALDATSAEAARQIVRVKSARLHG